MNKDELFKLLENLDDDYVAEAGDKLTRYYQRKDQRRFPFGAATAMAACAAVFAAVVILFKTNVIPTLPFNSSEISSGSSEGVSIDLTNENKFEFTLNAAFAYDGETGKLKRYEVGDEFGKYTSIKSASATPLYSESETLLKKQEIVLSYDEGADLNIIYAYPDAAVYESLELPSFGEGFRIIYEEPDAENTSGEIFAYTLSDIRLTVDHETKTILFSGGMGLSNIEKGNIENEDQ